MTKRRRIVLVVACVVLGLAGWLGIEVRRWYRQTRAEYHTAQAIGLVTTFVEQHRGNWPRSWDELGAPEYLRDGDVVVDFHADPERLIDDHQSIHTVIKPFTGAFVKLRFVDGMLRELRRLLAEKRAGRYSAAVLGPTPSSACRVKTPIMTTTVATSRGSHENPLRPSRDTSAAPG